MVDHVAAHELKLYIDNDYQLYSGQRKSIEDNLLKKKNAGTYDSAKAKKLWGYLAESGAKKYAKEFGGPVFPPAVRRQTAEELRDDFEAAWRAGEYTSRQDALKTKAQRKASFNPNEMWAQLKAEAAGASLPVRTIAGPMRVGARRKRPVSHHTQVRKLSARRWALVVGGQQAAVFTSKKEADDLADALNAMTLAQARKEAGM